MSIYQFLAVFLGGGAGACARYGLTVLGGRLWGAAYPLATLLINVSGAFLIGVCFALWASRPGLPPGGRLFLMTGVLGGYTTFSSYALEVVTLYERGENVAALSYAVLSVIGAVLAAACGVGLVRCFFLPGGRSLF